MTVPALELLAARTGLSLPLLFEARQVTERRLERRQELVAGIAFPNEATLVFVGSWGRREVTTGSDNDFYVLVLNEPKQVSADLLESVREALAREQREHRADDLRERDPGSEKVFGKAVSLGNLLRKIGRNPDTNENLTHRMLLVLESVSIQNPDFHRDARDAIVANYLERPVKTCQPPRLFLNDVVRYWRTMCVDFAGKMRERSGQGWGLRNAKLRTTRKMLFASGLLPVLRCGSLGEREIGPFLREQFAAPPTDRVADAFLALGMEDVGASVFDAYERFLREIDAEDIRDALDRISSREEADKSELFQSVAGIGNEIENGLLNLLFDSELHPVAQRFGIF